jgi:multicomponent Na+:H+ antiporter subunit E
VWVLLWGDVSIGNVLAGVAIGVAVTVGLRMAPIQFHGRVRPIALVVLIGRFLLDLVRASFEVAAIALRPGYTPRGAVIGVQLRSHSDLYLTLTAELCSLVPGSLVVEAHRLTGTLYVHVLDVAWSGGVEAARHQVLDQEERVLRALASADELTAAGLGRQRPGGTGPGRTEPGDTGSPRTGVPG